MTTDRAIPTLRRREFASLVGAAVALPLLAQPVAGQPVASDPLASSTGIVLQPGTYRIAANTTVKTDLTLLPGARIEIAAGRVLTVLGCFSAPVAAVFAGSGTVDLNHGRTPVAYPEWWGAIANDGALDCGPGLAACLAAHPFMMLGAGDYYLDRTFAVERPFVRIWGAGGRGALPGQGTRLILRGGDGDVVRVGSLEKPTSVNAFLQNVDMRWINLTRLAPVNTAGDAAPAGLRVQFVLCCQFEGLTSYENATGFAVKGAVRSFLRDCMAFRSQNGRQAGGRFRGFYLDGRSDIGLAGGNASLFVENCAASIGGRPDVADPVGLLLDAGFADSFITNFETSGLATGIRAAGQSGQLGNRAIAAHGNLHVRMPILDQCVVGIEISDTSPHGLIDIAEPYVALAPNGQTALRFTDVRGPLTLIGGQCYGRLDTAGQAMGLSAVGSSGLSVSGLKLLEFARPVRLDRCVGIDLRATIANPGRQTPQAAVAVSRCTGAAIAVQLLGRGEAFRAGVEVADEQGGGVSVDLVGLGAPVIAGGADRRVIVGTRNAGKAGRYGNVMVVGA